MYTYNSPSTLSAATDAYKLPHPPKGYVWVYEADGLSGLGRFKLKKVVQRAVKIVKKVAPIVAVGVGAYFAAPWFVTLAKSVGTAMATKIVQNRAAGGVPADTATQETSTPAVPDWAATAANVYIAKTTADKAAEEAAKAQAAQYEKDKQDMIAAQNRARQEQAERVAMQREASRQARLQTQTQTQTQETITGEETATGTAKTPAWLLPAAAVGAAALLMMTA